MSLDFFFGELFGEVANVAMKVAFDILVHIVLCKVGNPSNDILVAFLLQSDTTEDVVHCLLHYFFAV